MCTVESGARRTAARAALRGRRGVGSDLDHRGQEAIALPCSSSSRTSPEQAGVHP
jgi:hypothetical protein